MYRQKNFEYQFSVFLTENLLALQAEFACSENEMSTILHELIHWQDAKNYKKKFGEINDYIEYCNYLNKIYAPKVEKLIQKGYNINGISEYAVREYSKRNFDEVFNEYRVKCYLKR